MSEDWLAASATGVRVTVRVHPRARREGVRGVHAGALKVEVTAAPERGAANRAVATLLAGLLGVSRGAVAVVSGHGSRLKVVEARGVAPEDARRRLAAALEAAVGRTGEGGGRT